MDNIEDTRTSQCYTCSYIKKDYAFIVVNLLQTNKIHGLRCVPFCRAMLHVHTGLIFISRLICV